MVAPPESWYDNFFRAEETLSPGRHLLARIDHGDPARTKKVVVTVLDYNGRRLKEFVLALRDHNSYVTMSPTGDLFASTLGLGFTALDSPSHWPYRVYLVDDQGRYLREREMGTLRTWRFSFSPNGKRLACFVDDTADPDRQRYLVVLKVPSLEEELKIELDKIAVDAGWLDDEKAYVLHINREGSIRILTCEIRDPRLRLEKEWKLKGRPLGGAQYATGPDGLVLFVLKTREPPTEDAGPSMDGYLVLLICDVLTRELYRAPNQKILHSMACSRCDQRTSDATSATVQPRRAGGERWRWKGT
ncbi:MAG: hypothetical protein DWB60_04600 [Armatimonadetes bacterium]|nr:hypothetical protein [Armatimonadota bacterium]